MAGSSVGRAPGRAEAAAAFDCLVVEAPLCCDVAATEFVGKSSAIVTGAAGDATIVLGNNGGCAYAATDFEGCDEFKGCRDVFLLEVPPLFWETNGGSACAATDFQDATNSQCVCVCVWNNTFASAFREFDIDRFRMQRATEKLPVPGGALVALLPSHPCMRAISS